MKELYQIDSLARESALDTSQSFIVEAPAGSGKTELLIQRFLSLLVKVNHPEEILAITFTKKAASEMRHRIISALMNAQLKTEIKSEHENKTRNMATKVLQRNQQLSWQLLENPNQLKIQTIDSFCNYLSKQLPILSQLGASPEITTEPYLLYEEAALAVIMQVEQDNEWSPHVKTLLLHLDNDLDKLRTLLVNMLAKRDQWLPYIYAHQNVNQVRKLLENNLALLVEEKLRLVSPLFTAEITQELLPLVRAAASNLNLEKNSDSPLVECEYLATLPSCKASYRNQWIAISQFLLTKKFEFRKRPDPEIGFTQLNTLVNKTEIQIHKSLRECYVNLLKKLEGREKLRSALQEIQLLPEITYTDKQWKILEALINLLKIVNVQLRLIFQTYGKIDFIENTQAALMTLGDIDNPTDLALSLDYQICHILIDEFQDTSHTQYQIVEKLIASWQKNDGRTLFVVGDPMQSIYRFREADVGLFIRMCQFGIGNLPLTPLKLTINFRSKNEIVSWNNDIFSRLFPCQNDSAIGAVSYNHCIAFDKTEKNSDSVMIKISGFINHGTTAEAEAIKDVIVEQLKLFPHDNIAILVKSRSHLKTLLPILQKNSILYQANEIDSLDSKQHIQDLLALTRALLNPTDRIAWLAILRAPWCGLTLNELLILVDNNNHKTLFESVKYFASNHLLSESSQKLFAKFSNIILTQHSLKMRDSLREWIENTWLQLGGPACLDNLSDIEDANVYFRLLEELEKNDEFNLKILTKKLNKLFAQNHHTNSRVQIMTIHAAKGLEFDTIILPQLERKNPNNDKSLMLWLEQTFLDKQSIFMLAPIHEFGLPEDSLYRYIQTQNTIKTKLELDRLLYVAASRAKKRLFLSFNATKEESIRIQSNSFLEKIWPHIRSTDKLTMNENLNKQSQNMQARTPLRPLKKLLSIWINPFIIPLASTNTLYEIGPGFPFPSSTPQKIGSITHRILQHMGMHSVKWWSDLSNENKKSLVVSKLRQHNIPQIERENAMNKILSAINLTLEDSRGQWILKNHHESNTEFKISVLLNGKIENFVIDRTFIDEDNVRWIIDYKTSFTSEDIEQFITKEKKIYQKKMALYQAAFRKFEHREIKLGLYFPLIPAWNEWSTSESNVDPVML